MLKKYGMDKKWLAFLAVFILTIAATFIFYQKTDMSYEFADSSTIRYVKGKVTEVLSEELEKADGNDPRILGTQKVRVYIKEGEQKGKELEFDNVLSTTHNIYVKPGQAVLIKADMPEGAAPYYSIFNYDRTGGIAAIAVIFILLMALVGRSKGIKSVIGLLYVFLLIIGFLIPAIYSGWPPVLATVLMAVTASAVSMILLNGFSAKTWTAILSTVAGILIAAFVFAIFAWILFVDGYKLDEVEELILVSNSSGMKVGDILFAGTLVSSLGAIMDMTMSVAAPLYEMREANNKMSSREIYRTGLKIGKDMIGTMCETLVLAFTGTAITTLLLLKAYGIHMDQLLSSDYIAIELAQGLTGSIAVILAVPITSLLAGLSGKKGVHYL